MKQLRVSENHRYLLSGDEPFFWLGDTAWLMLQKLSEQEIRLYLENRAGKGFNVIQTVLVHYLPDNKGWEDGFKDPTTADYFAFAKHIAEIADSLGIYLALLPSWGSILKKGIINMSNAERYAEYLAETFSDCSNIVWVMGGDVRGDSIFDVVSLLARTLKSKLPDCFITYHPFGRTSSSRWFADQDWLDMNMFQSGHRRYDQEVLGNWDDKVQGEIYYGEDNWRYVEHDLAITSMKPVLDAEPSYEGILQGLHNKKEPYWQDCDVRRYAYWSVMQGSCGHTYGCNAIMQFYDDESVAGGYGVRETWQTALHAPGASQMGFLRRIAERLGFWNARHAEQRLVYGQKERYHRISVLEGEGFILCYTYMGDEFALDLSDLAGIWAKIYWIDPENGIESLAEITSLPEKKVFRPYRKDRPVNDWLLLIKF